MSDYEDEDEVRFEPEKGAYERTGPAGLAAGVKPMSAKEERLLLMSMSPLERFIHYVNGIARNYTSKDIYQFTEDHIQYMLEAARNVDHVEHKNPTAFVLGYIVSKGGKGIDKRMVKTIFNQLNLINAMDKSTKLGGFITKPDVIRYGRYWLILRKRQA